MLLLLDEHLGTDQIAKRLFISEHTVRSHVKSLLRKLGVSSRAARRSSCARRRAVLTSRTRAALKARSAQSPTVGDAVGDAPARPAPIM